MSDFASAAMVRLLVQGMQRRGLQPPAPAIAASKGRSTVGLNLKRELVAAAWAQGGPSALLRLGEGVQAMPPDATARALLAAADVPSGLARWQRLERYIHSRHRVHQYRCEVSGSGFGVAELEHLAPPGQPVPLPGEDLVVLGVLVALLPAWGAGPSTARVEGVPVLPETDEAGLLRLIERGRTGRWELRWQCSPRQTATVGAPAAGNGQAPRSVGGPGPAAPTESLLPEQIKARAAQCLAGQLLQPPSALALAQGLGLPLRSLQRSLALAQTSYRLLLHEARAQAAAAGLIQQQLGLAELGFMCGYTDQAHFTREFKRRVGLTPASYRREFALS
jgi:AraC-like DNA-binding protein